MIVSIRGTSRVKSSIIPVEVIFNNLISTANTKSQTSGTFKTEIERRIQISHLFEITCDGLMVFYQPKNPKSR